MGKLILCSGERTDKPYMFIETGVRVYSIEEICYYLYHHIYIIDDTVFCDALIDFIEKELGLKERAEKLCQLKKQKADIKSMVTVILCSTDYYTEAEIKRILKVLDEIAGMPPVKRSCVKAANYLSEHKYSIAASEYERIINSTEAAELTPEEYGDLFHNLAVAKVHITGLREASRLFHQAYERNHRKETLIQYLYTVKLRGNEEEYQSLAAEYELGPELDHQITEQFKEAVEKAGNSDKRKEIEELYQLRARGKMSEFYEKTDEIIEGWKDMVRQY